MEKTTNGYFLLMVGAFIFFLISLYWAYWPWFKPREWYIHIWKRRLSIQKDWWFLPENVTFSFLSKRPTFDLWYARIGYLIMALLFLGITFLMYWSILYVSEHGHI